MRLVIITYGGDEYTYSFVDTTPVEYESAEAFLVEFEEICRSDKSKFRVDEFTFANKTWYISNYVKYASDTEELYVCLPEVLTVDEWFARWG
jgi:hypothetical protein